MSRIALLSITAVGVWGVLVGSSRAELLMYEPFNYAGASLNGQSGGGEFGLTGVWSDNTSLSAGGYNHVGPVSLSGDNVSLSHPLLPAGLGGRVSDAGPGTALRDLVTSIDMSTAGVYYVSGLFSGQAVVQFQNSSFRRASFGIGPLGFEVGMNLGNDPPQRSAGWTYAQGAGTYSEDATYFLVAKISKNTGSGGTDQLFLKVYDATMAIDLTEPATWDYSMSANSGVVQNSVTLAFFPDTSGQIDELRIATTWADAVPAIPEPATLLLLLSGGLLLLAGRRRSSTRP